ncbi:methionine aminopeptidase, type I [Desulfocapsa sulfexigens DSM 10523]|uniref:Methionine aminopeptidase n=1 Tax=Desulfocapsa sulfexigens (strain DSM 10523 / SB164P1) TaxID=1167006 RepID=M1P1Q3_DESSD|nr:type I methionyl aminopeptidase [Desulfocapsa sulfexigens]AGF77423.1 methionine aminopeptidase, type I [Desulfocapsa sulfexigens DSM 10523]
MIVPGRNELCWCGSGKKYKRCHLRSDQKGETVPPDANELVAGKAPVGPGTLSLPRRVPDHIFLPEYAITGKTGNSGKSCKKESDDEISRMRRAGGVARKVLDSVLAAVELGVSTDALDEIAHEAAIAHGAYPSPLNYMGFPKSICTSVNEVILHGIPDSRKLQNGDIINCDVTVYIDGMHGDCSETVLVGDVTEEAFSLVQCTWECLMKGIDVVRPGQRFNEIGRVIEAHAAKYGYVVFRPYGGHGIGEHFHMFPFVAHSYDPENKAVMEEGMTFTIEPMINCGGHGARVWNDNWTTVTADLALSAQFEHTILVNSGGVEILTGGLEPWFLRDGKRRLE